MIRNPRNQAMMPNFEINDISKQKELQQRIAQGISQNQFTNVPPAPSNEFNTPNPTFDPLSQQMAMGVFGDNQMRQNAVGATPLYEITEEELKKREKAAKKESKKNKIKLSKDIEPYEFSRLNKNSYFYDYDYDQDYTPPMTEREIREQAAGEKDPFKTSNAPLFNDPKKGKKKKMADKPRKKERYTRKDGSVVDTDGKIYPKGFFDKQRPK
jgi:hypothetical protein|tara:strand:- start:528 stop:1163 length:636 start_codon:yes stop_codon:yes gene_type:complete